MARILDAVVLPLVLTLAGCAATQSVERAQSYTPIVDMQGVDFARYSRDLSDCRTYTSVVQIDDARPANMHIAAVLPTLADHGRAHNKDERIVMNCMTGRSYRTLDGALVVPANFAASTNAVIDGGKIVATENPVAPKRPAEGGRKASTFFGKDRYQAEQYARSQSCQAALATSPVDRSPGVETYQLACANGATMRVRCTFGNCLALQ